MSEIRSPGRRGNLQSLLVILLFVPLTVKQPEHIAHSCKLFSVTVEHSQRDTLSGSDRNLLPERRLELRSSSGSSPWLKMMSQWQVIKASLERDLAAAKKQGTKSSRLMAIKFEEKSEWISGETSRLTQLSEDITKAKTALEARTAAIQLEEGRLVEPAGGAQETESNQPEPILIGNQSDNRQENSENLTANVLVQQNHSL